MKLYHGSNVPINSIDLSKSHKGKDFGKGFYVSDNFEQAFQMATNTVALRNEGQATVTVFECDDSLLQSDTLRVLRFNDYSLEWAKFVIDNRKNLSDVNIHDYDIVILLMTVLAHSCTDTVSDY